MLRIPMDHDGVTLPLGGSSSEEWTMAVKPTFEELRVSGRSLDWQRSQRSGQAGGELEIAFTCVNGQHWTLMRVCDDPSSRVMVFSRFEWDCFLDGARNGEFDDAASG